MKPAIKELRFPGVRLLTTEDLIVFSPEGTTTFPAVKVEKVENKLEVSIVKEIRDGHLAFRDVALDDHGTIKAAIHVLSRHFRWEKITQTARFGTPVWKLKAKRFEDFDLYIIAYWEGWNAAGIRWDERNYRAQTCETSLGKMERKTFMQRCRRMGLKYRV